MKKLLLIIGLLLASLSYGQEKLVIGESLETPVLIDSGNRIRVEYLIHNCKIEIDGHIVKDKIWFKAAFDGIEITDEKGNKYQKRKCSIDKCDILHLEILYEAIRISSGCIINPSYNLLAH
jgi:hypothetical protein